MTFTITTSAKSSITGFNIDGQRFAAVYNGGGKYFVGRGASYEVDHMTAEGEVDTFDGALAWVVSQLMGA